MALSMDEQRMLAEIERRLAAEDPRLAARLSAFRRPSRVNLFRSARARVIGSLLTVAVVAMVSLMVYAMLPFRSGARAAGHVTTTVSTGTGQPKIGAGPGANAGTNAGVNAGPTVANGSTGKNAGPSAPASAKNAGHNAGKSQAAKAAAGSTAQQSAASHPAGTAVHQADGSPGNTASTAGQGP